MGNIINRIILLAGSRKAKHNTFGINREYYLKENPDVALSGRDPAEHYFEVGWKKGLDPSEYFSTTGYLAANPDIAAAEINPLQHFLTSGLAEGRTGWCKRRAEERSSSEPVWGFDREYYLRNNPDVALNGRDPAEHYFEVGWKKGRDPSEYFSTTGYLAANPDIAAAEMNPLQHFLTSGLAEGRTGWCKRRAEEPSSSEPVWGFDREYYLRNNPDVALSGRDPAEHYFEVGWKKGLDPSEYFSTTGYLVANPDVAAAEMNPLQHFLTSGLAEDRTGWRKRSAEEWGALAARELGAVGDRVETLRSSISGERIDEAGLEPPDSAAPIPLTPRALRIFARVARIARSQS